MFLQVSLVFFTGVILVILLVGIIIGLSLGIMLFRSSRH
jgi:hypothetical protein